MPKYANSSSRPVRKSRVTALTPRARGARKIEGILQEKARAPSGGMIGEKLIKPIGVLGHDLHGVRAVGLEDANRPGGSNPITVKEDHDLPNNLLFGPGVRDSLGPNRADARDLAKPVRLGLDDVEDLLPEGLDHLLGIDRPDATDHPGAEIFLDPVD